MDRFLEFVGNHPFLWTLFVGILIAWVIFEVRDRAKGYLVIGNMDFTRLLNSGQAMLIDLRPTADYDRGHIRGARHLTPTQVDPDAKDLQRYKEQPVLLYCQAGMNSGEVAARLIKAGYAKVYSLKGGIAAWLAEQLPVEKGKNR